MAGSLPGVSARGSFASDCRGWVGAGNAVRLQGAPWVAMAGRNGGHHRRGNMGCRSPARGPLAKQTGRPDRFPDRNRPDATARCNQLYRRNRPSRSLATGGNRVPRRGNSHACRSVVTAVLGLSFSPQQVAVESKSSAQKSNQGFGTTDRCLKDGDWVHRRAGHVAQLQWCKSQHKLVAAPLPAGLAQLLQVRVVDQP